MTQVTRGFMLTLSAESIAEKVLEDLDLPRDAMLFKIVPSQDRSNCFDFLFYSGKGFETIEGDHFVRIMSKEDLPKPKEEDLTVKETVGVKLPPEEKK